ncbi:putative transposase [Nostoc carneum NIES-2107]|nr:putative transposase [Nostoc carneum NIES-2107]
MRPPIWQPPIELSPKESTVVKRIRKAKLFVFLRQIRHELFDSDFQLNLIQVENCSFSKGNREQGTGKRIGFYCQILFGKN